MKIDRKIELFLLYQPLKHNINSKGKIKILIIIMLIKNMMCFSITNKLFGGLRKFSSIIKPKQLTQPTQPTQPTQQTQFQYISDIHVDSRFCVTKFPDVENLTDTLLIAGDVGNPFHENFHVFMKRMANLFAKIIFVAGNHEYDSGCLFDKTKYDTYKLQLEKIFKQLPNVFFLDNDICQLNNQIIVAGTTLWSDPKLYYPIYKKEKLTASQYDTHIEKHIESVNFIENVCAKYSDKKIIVLSHFVPTFKLIEHKYLSNGKANGWFATDLEHLIKKPINAWICGHSHSVITKKINGVYCGLNAHGYSKENNLNMINNKMFSI